MISRLLTTIVTVAVPHVRAITIEPDAHPTYKMGGGGAPFGGKYDFNNDTNFNIGEAGQDIIPHATVGNYQENFWSWVSSLLSVLMPVAFLLVLLYLIWGAFDWITAEGDSSKLEKARKKMMHAVIGLLLLVSAFIVIGFVSSLLFGESFDILNLNWIFAREQS